jgi:hypothetical protein
MNKKRTAAEQLADDLEGCNGDAQEIASITMVGDLLGALIDEIRTLPDVWQKTSEEKQGIIIERLTRRIEAAVSNAVHIIAADGKPQIVATLEGVGLKSKIKASLIVHAGNPLLHELFDSVGESVLIVLPNTAQFMGGKDQVKPDKDQPEIALNTTE